MQAKHAHKTKWLWAAVLILFVGFLVALVSVLTLKEQLGHTALGRMELGDFPTVAADAGDGNTVIGTREGLIEVLDEYGVPQWQYTAGNAVLDVKSVGSTVYASADDRYVYLFSGNGEVQGQIAVRFRPVTFSVSGDGGLIAVGSTLSFDKNAVQLFDASGNLLYGGDVDTVINDVFVTGDQDVLYITDDAQIVKIDKQGAVLSRAATDARAACASYSQEDGLLAVADETGKIYVFTDSMELRWSAMGSGTAQSVNVVSGTGRVAVAYDDGIIEIYSETGSLMAQTDTGESVLGMYYAGENGTLNTYSSDGTLVRTDEYALSQSAGRAAACALLMKVSILLGALTLVSALLMIGRIRRAVFSGVRRFGLCIYRHRLPYLLLLPSVTLLVVFNYYPIINGLIIAFTEYTPGISTKFVGFDNFIAMFRDHYFWYGFGNMALLLLTDLLKALIPSVIFAELILALRSRKAQYWTRVLLFIPGILPGVAGLLVWTNGILGMDGLVNGLLKLVGLSNLATSWLGNESTAIWALIFIGFPWLGSYLIIYGALINLPDSLFDAAKIDGCGWLRRIRYVDIPLVRPQLKYLFVISFIASVQDFGRIYVTTGGGPGHATYTPMLELYFNMSKFQNYGLASAMGLFLFLIIFSATLFNMKARVSSGE